MNINSPIQKSKEKKGPKEGEARGKINIIPSEESPEDKPLNSISIISSNLKTQQQGERRQSPRTPRVSETTKKVKNLLRGLKKGMKRIVRDQTRRIHFMPLEEADLQKLNLGLETTAIRTRMDSLRPLKLICPRFCSWRRYATTGHGTNGPMGLNQGPCWGSETPRL